MPIDDAEDSRSGSQCETGANATRMVWVLIRYICECKKIGILQLEISPKDREG